ncbi:MAG: DM13 domain-containing protein, partial [Planctomycetota bacterium]|nr:DM13 domain-containing protein [Planctomycetota bacterium]
SGRLAAGALIAGFLLVNATAPAGGLYGRAGWVADIPPGAHDAEAVATIIDARTIHVEHFTYDGTAPAVYFYLGETNTDEDFMNGLQLQPELDRPYNDESLTLFLPEGETLEGYGAISVWCAEFDANFSSASFEEPAETYDRAGWAADMPPGSHDAEGVATIINERIVFIEQFTYDGLAPAVYFYLGETNTYNDFLNGLEVPPELTREYDDESLVRTLPDGETLEGWGAISVWCAAAEANFTSAAFQAPCPADLDDDGMVNTADLLALLAAWGSDDADADVNCDGIVDTADLLDLLAAWGACP